MHNISFTPFNINNDINSYTEEQKEEIAKKFLEEDPLSFAQKIQKLNIQSQKTLIKLAIIHAKKNFLSLLESIDYYKIDFNTNEEKKILEKIFDISSRNGSASSFLNNLPTFNVESQTILIQLAKKVLEHNLFLFLTHIENFKINFDTFEGKDFLEEIVEIASQKNVVLPLFSKKIEKFNIQSQTTLIQLAKKVAEHDLSLFLGGMERFKINFNTKEGEIALQEIVSIAFKRSLNVLYLMDHIDKFNIQSQTTLIQLAKKVAEQNLSLFLRNITRFKINFNTEEGKTALQEIAHTASKKGSASLFLGHLDKFNIQSQETSIKLAKIFVERGSYLSLVLTHIKEFNINFNTAEGKKFLDEIFEIASENQLLDIFLKNILEFNIQSQTTLIKLAKKIAEKNLNSLCQNIKNFGIDFNNKKGQEALEQIVDLALDKRGVYIFSRNIVSFNIKSQEVLLQLAKKIAEKDLKALCLNVKNLGIDFNNEKGQEVLEQIVDFALDKQEVHIFSRNIVNFNIKSQEARLQLAKKIAEKNTGNTIELCANIEYFKINFNNEKGKELLEQIVDVVLKEKYAYAFSKIIDKFNIESEKARAQIAKKIAEKDFTALCLNVKNFDIDFNTTKGKKTLHELVCIVLKEKNSELFLENISEFKISSQDELIKIVKMILKQEITKDILPLIQNCFFKDEIPLETAFSMFQKTCKEDLGLPSSFLSWINDSYHLIAKNHDKRKFLKWALVISIFSSLNSQTGCVIQNIPLLSSIRKTPPWLKDLLTVELFKFYENFNENKNELLQMFRNVCKEEKKRKTVNAIPIHIEIPALIFARYPSEARQACLKALNKIKNERLLLREEKNKKIIFDMLLKVSNSSLAPHTVSKVIEELFHLSGENLLKGCKLVGNLLSFNETVYFQDLSESGVTENGLIKDLENSLNIFFKKTFNCDVENFGEKYVQTLETWRSTDSLITFAGKMNFLSDEREKKLALQLLEKFVTTVLNDNFQKTRYETNSNPHLFLIKSKAPATFEKWQENLNLEPLEIVREQKKKISKFDAIKNQILTGLRNDHLGKKDLYPHIEQYLNTPSEINLLIENINNKMRSFDNALSKEDFASKKRISIEKSILEFLSMKFTDGQEQLLVKSLQALIGKLPKNNEFRQTDLESCLKLATSKGSGNTSFKVIESDQPNDFLLMGTEVDGSCQNVNSSPELNKCILGYALDGKHKLLLVKDSYGKILARAVVRFLVDKNETPVLFLERTYASDANPLYSINLRKLALKKAHDLGIPILSAESGDSNSKPFHSAIFAKEKPVSFEYVDALNGIQRGSYSINNLYELIEEI